jgi:hypothetical protein
MKKMKWKIPLCSAIIYFCMISSIPTRDIIKVVILAILSLNPSSWNNMKILITPRMNMGKKMRIRTSQGSLYRT